MIHLISDRISNLTSSFILSIFEIPIVQLNPKEVNSLFSALVEEYVPTQRDDFFSTDRMQKSATLASERPELYGLRKHEFVGYVFTVAVCLGTNIESNILASILG